ncbi:response regulator [Prosthecochloris sp. SCSIO W1101]|uniref:response regulator n=1 Tax=Prosthecochloris sp. SCSIO W1101 TaxID=2992242 RepID=UPI002AC82708|nr:response regulator [Prosthecochloris sp. SCSIO W1101]
MKQSRILVVDDSPSIRRLLSHNLGKKFKVLLAENAQGALDLLDKGQMPDLMIVDVAMPGMDGFSFVDRIRQDSVYNAIPLIMLTAGTRAATKKKD